MIYVHNQKWSCQTVLVQIFRENATASKSVPLQNSTIYLSTFQNLSVKIVNCFCLYLEMYISKLICPNCQGGCNGQLKGTFDLNSSAELNSYSNRRSQIWPSCRIQHCPMMWVLQRIFLINIKEFKLYLSTKKPERKVARVFVRLEGVRLGEVDGIWRR